MKVAVLTNCVPFLTGGAEHLGLALTRKLKEYGHHAMLVRIPFEWDPPGRIVEGMLSCRLMRLPNVDRVVALKFPAYYAPHDNKVLWLLHQFRQAYDFWGTEFHGLPSGQEGAQIRESIVQSDNRHLRQARAIYTNSRVTSERLKKYNGIDSRVLWPPLLDSEKFTCREYGNFIFYPSRVNATKRQHLLVESMKHVKSGARLIIAGAAEDAAYETRIDALMREIPGRRVEWLRGFIDEERKADLFSRALASAYIPYDEDSYGYVTLESYSARKAVLTCTDSGGTDLLVQNGITGLAVEPEPQRLAAAIDRLYEDRGAAQRMGEAGFARVKELGITWDRVIETLTA